MALYKLDVSRASHEVKVIWYTNKTFFVHGEVDSYASPSEEASKEKTELASILQNCLSSLGQYIQKSNAEPFRKRSYHNEELTELQSSISQLSVKFIDQEMEDDFLSFIQFPSESSAIHLRSQILAFIEQHSDIGAQSIKPKHNREWQLVNHVLKF